jgi:hypothetical protein
MTVKSKNYKVWKDLASNLWLCSGPVPVNSYQTHTVWVTNKLVKAKVFKGKTPFEAFYRSKKFTEALYKGYSL